MSEKRTSISVELTLPAGELASSFRNASSIAGETATTGGEPRSTIRETTSMIVATTSHGRQRTSIFRQLAPTIQYRTSIFPQPAPTIHYRTSIFLQPAPTSATERQPSVTECQPSDKPLRPFVTAPHAVGNFVNSPGTRLDASRSNLYSTRTGTLAKRIPFCPAVRTSMRSSPGRVGVYI